MSSKSLLLCGNEALVHGALLAGCDAYFGYPITPAGEIIECAAKKFPELGRVFIQAESEIGAICMVMGAAAAGQRAMTASSPFLISPAWKFPASSPTSCAAVPASGTSASNRATIFRSSKAAGTAATAAPCSLPQARRKCAPRRSRPSNSPKNTARRSTF